MPFPTTHWSLLAQATIHGDAVQREALAEFYRRYRAPVLAFVTQRTPDRARAEDLAQDFFLHLMENSVLQRATPQRGRFRSFLLGTLVRFLARDRAHASAGKRGGGESPVPLETGQAEADGATVPPEVERAFDRVWARELLARARTEVEAAWRAQRSPAEWVAVAAFLPGAISTPTYEEAAATLGWTVARLKTEVFRLRQKFRETVRADVMLTVDAPHEVETELAHLHRVLADTRA